MNNSTPTAQSGPSAWAIAQAFRERFTACDIAIDAAFELQHIHHRATEIDATTPPAGARDAVTDALEALAVRFDKRDQWMRTKSVPNIGLADAFKDAAADIRALAGKADGWAAMTKAAMDLKLRHVDNHQGDIYHALQSLIVKFGKPWDGKLTEPTQPAATGAGEVGGTAWVRPSHCSWPACGCTTAGGKRCAPDPTPETNTAAPGMGEDRAARMLAYVTDTATRHGWNEADGEGALEFLFRKHYATGRDDALAAQHAPVVGVTPEMVQDVFDRLPAQLNAKGRHEFFAERLNEKLLAARPGGEEVGRGTIEPRNYMGQNYMGIQWRVNPRLRPREIRICTGDHMALFLIDYEGMAMVEIGQAAHPAQAGGGAE